MYPFNPVRLIQMLWLSLRCGTFIPFKIFSPAKIKIKSGAKIKNNGRITIGTQKNQAIISIQPSLLFMGPNSTLTTGKSISIGPGVKIILKANSNINIGDSTYFTSDNHIEAIKEITIGKDCAISWGVTIIDSDHHQMITESINESDLGVKIGNHVWVGCNVTILRNTSIGDNCVIAAGSIVKGKFPNNSLIGGNPARIIKENIDWN